MKMKSIKFNVLMNLIKTLLSVLFPLVTFPYISRILMVDGLGKANYVISIASYFKLVAGLGISTYAITYGSKIRENKEKLDKFASEMVLISFVSTIISVSALYVLIIFNKFEGYEFLLLIESISILLIPLGMDWIFNIIENYKYITIRYIVVQMISLILLFTLVRNSNDIWIYIAILVISSSGSNIFNFFYARRFISLFKQSISIKDLTKHIKPILVIFATSVASTIYLNSDITILGYLKGDFEVGLYVSAIKVNRIVILIISAINAVLLPRLSYYIEKLQKQNYEQIIYKAINAMFLLIFPAVIGVYLLSGEIILVLAGPDFIKANVIMKIMSINILLSTMNGFLAYQVLMPLKKQNLTMFATMLGAVVNIILNIILIPKNGGVGAAIATIISEVVVSIILIIFTQKYIAWKNNLRYIHHYLFSSLFIIPLNSVVRLFDIRFELQMLSIIFGSIILYFTLLLLQKNPPLISLVKNFKNNRKVT